MNKSTLARTGIAGAVAGLGLAAGGVAMASAENDTSDNAASLSAHQGGPRGDRGPGAQADTLAKELGLDEAVVTKALQAVRDDLRTDERDARQAKLAAALAKELDVSKAKVAAALEVAQKAAETDRQERQTTSRDELATRLDAAIKAGTLTEADKVSVLKAFDADLIGGGFGGGPGGRGHGGPAAPAA